METSLDFSVSGEDFFGVGDAVQCRYRGRSKFYPGVIAGAHDDGTYDINYDDGEQEMHVLAAFVKGREFPVGTKVDSRYRGHSKFYPAVVAAHHDDGTYDIDYDDGEHEANVSAEFIRHRTVLITAEQLVAATDDAPPVFSVGARVDTRYRGRSKYYPGAVAAVHDDGTYDIDYDDGEQEKHVVPELIRAQKEPASPGKNKSDVPAAATAPSFAIGARVDTRYRGKSNLYPGVVAADQEDGTYDIE